MRRLVAVLALALSWPAMASAATLVLSERQQQEAIEAGERSVTADGFDAEWRVAGAAGETATVITPFHRLAIAARHAAFNGKPLRPGEPAKILKENRDRLVFWISVRGPSEDFARHYVPKLLVGDREIKASFVQNERTAMRQDDGRYLARCVYGFPTRDVKGRERVALVIGNGDGREVSRFTIDLALMR
ncbi:MAG TPA: hypothetical protein VIE36_02605 [Methylomirabilota bacterium]